MHLNLSGNRKKWNSKISVVKKISNDPVRDFFDWAKLIFPYEKNFLKEIFIK